jgi:hypothetical protein
MSYFSNTENRSSLEGLGCGPQCSCAPCRSGVSGLDEWYQRDQSHRPVAQSSAGPSAPQSLNESESGVSDRASGRRNPPAAARASVATTAVANLPAIQQQILQSALGRGVRNLSQLTAALFFARHPLQRSEWVHIRDQIVRPALPRTAVNNGILVRPVGLNGFSNFGSVYVPKANQQTQLADLHGLAQPRDTSDHRRSLDAILKALQLNPAGGYVKGSSARTKLEEALKSVPVTSAFEIFNQLKNGVGSLGKMFQYRLHDATKLVMLNILWAKHLEQQKQLRDAQEVLKSVCEDEKKAIERQRAALKDFDEAVEKVCKLSGENSDACQKARFRLLEAKTRLADTVRANTARCP